MRDHGRAGWLGVGAIAALGVALGASVASAQDRTECCSVKVITRFSEDPNDFISPSAVPIGVKIGSIDAVTCNGSEECGGDNGIIRVAVPPGRYRVRVPKENLEPLGYKVGYVSNAPTGTGVVTKCFPNPVDGTDPTGLEGNVELVVSASDFNPSSASDYELSVRLVPVAAGPLKGPPDGEGVACPAGGTGGGGGGGGGGTTDKKDKKRPDVADIVGPWTGEWKNKKLGTSGTANATVTEPEEGVVQIETQIIGDILRCATELIENPILLSSGTDYVEDGSNGDITQVNFQRTNNVFGDVKVEGIGKRNLQATAASTCGGLGPAVEATGKINKKFTAASIKIKLTYPDGEKAKASVAVGKTQ